jgi:hypothetical protein
MAPVGEGAASCLCAGAGSDAPFGQGTGQLLYSPVAGEPGGRNSSVPGSGPAALHFKKHCQPFPTSTMLLGLNPSCDLRSYSGGQSCCHHLFTLLDANQTTPWQDQPLVYHHKWRIWYAEVESAPEPISDLVQFDWGGMASPTEYDVPNCADPFLRNREGCVREAGGEWVHEHNGTWQVRDMLSAGWTPVGPSANTTGLSLKTIHGHCHAPTCIVFELWNQDSGELVCRQNASVGRSNRTYDEQGFLHVPPCVFGAAEEGLNPALRLPLNATLYSYKKCRAGFGHHGEMSLWQTYGVYV